MKKLAEFWVVAAAVFGAATIAPAGAQDENLASTVHVELLTADTVDGTLITVRANDGVVVLDGVVGTEQSKSEAEQLARNVRGVTSVSNQLTVDSTLAAQAQVGQDLAQPDSPHAEAAAMAPHAQGGAGAPGAQPGAAGMRAGSAAGDASAADAGSAQAADCIGARYRSRLLGQPLTQTSAKVSDEELRKSVTDALDNDPLLAGSDIRVTSASNGRVKLEGRAQAIPVHRHALLTAFHVPGVCRVASDITSPADAAAAAAVAPDADNAEAAASAPGADDDPTAPRAVVPIPVPVPVPVPQGAGEGVPVD
jgi:osmotically-inducible protein OsmY